MAEGFDWPETINPLRLWVFKVIHPEGRNPRHSGTKDYSRITFEIAHSPPNLRISPSSSVARRPRVGIPLLLTVHLQLYTGIPRG